MSGGFLNVYARVVSFLLVAAEVFRQMKLGGLLAVPDLRDKEATRRWLLLACDVAAMLATKTTLKTDDKVVAFLGRTIADSRLFDPFHELVVKLLGRGDGDGDTLKVGDKVGDVEIPQPLAAEAEKAGINPVVILSVITTVLDLLRSFGLIKRS